MREAVKLAPDPFDDIEVWMSCHVIILALCVAAKRALNMALLLLYFWRYGVRCLVICKQLLPAA